MQEEQDHEENSKQQQEPEEEEEKLKSHPLKEEDDEEEEDNDASSFSSTDRVHMDCTLINTESFNHQHIVSIASTGKLLICGTAIGDVHVLTLQGDLIHTIQWHLDRVSSICPRLENSLIITTSVDGRVGIIDEFDCSFKFKHRFAAGMANYAEIVPGRKELMYTLCTNDPMDPVLVCKESVFSFFDPTRAQSQAFSEWAKGHVAQLVWEPFGRFVCWNSDEAISVFDVLENGIVGLYPLSLLVAKEYAQILPCTIQWIICSAEKSELLIACGNSVHVLSVNVQKLSAEKEDSEYNALLKVENSFKLEGDWVICGATSHKGTDLVLLAVDSKQESGPTLFVCDRNGKVDKTARIPAGKSITFDQVKMAPSVFSSFSSVCHLLCDNKVYLLEIRDTDDEIDFLLSRKKYKQAFSRARILLKDNRLLHHTFEEIAQCYLDSLWSKGEREKFGKTLTRAGRIKEDLWKLYVNRLIEKKVLHFVVDYIPTKKPKFDRKFYDNILKYLYQNDLPNFAKMIDKWPTNLFHSKELLKRVQKDLLKFTENSEDPRALILKEVRTALAIYSGELDSAYEQYITRSTSVISPLKLKE
jgi:hypothetical protein